MFGQGTSIYDAEVRLAFFKEVGQQADFQAVLGHDLVGGNARSQANRRSPNQGEPREGYERQQSGSPRLSCSIRSAEYSAKLEREQNSFRPE